MYGMYSGEEGIHITFWRCRHRKRQASGLPCAWVLWGPFRLPNNGLLQCHPALHRTARCDYSPLLHDPQTNTTPLSHTTMNPSQLDWSAITTPLTSHRAQLVLTAVASGVAVGTTLLAFQSARQSQKLRDIKSSIRSRDDAATAVCSRPKPPRCDERPGNADSLAYRIRGTSHQLQAAGRARRGTRSEGETGRLGRRYAVCT